MIMKLNKSSNTYNFEPSINPASKAIAMMNSFDTQ
jgi:hypothetical protein